MGTVQMSALQFLDEVVRPVAVALDAPLPPVLGVKPTPATAAFDTFRAAVALVPGAGDPISISLPDPPSLPGAGAGGGAPPPPTGFGLQPIDPADALREIAKAVRDAESVLNEANLAIANASADVKLVVRVGGLAGADATLNVTISPVSEPIPKDQS